MKTGKLNQVAQRAKTGFTRECGKPKKGRMDRNACWCRRSFLPQIVFAANEDFDPIEGMSRLTELVLMLITGVGIFFLAFGVINLALSFQSHDESQKSRGNHGNRRRADCSWTTRIAAIYRGVNMKRPTAGKRSDGR